MPDGGTCSAGRISPLQPASGTPYLELPFNHQLHTDSFKCHTDAWASFGNDMGALLLDPPNAHIKVRTIVNDATHPTVATMSSLRKLADMISNSVQAIEDAYSSAGRELPDQNLPFDPSDTLAFSPEVMQHALLIVGAADQLSAAVRPPPMTMIDLAMSVSDPSTCSRSRALITVLVSCLGCTTGCTRRQRP